MTRRAPRLLAAILPAASDFAWSLPILFLFVRMNGARTLLGDGDTGWHIRSGEWILAHGRVPRQDIFSFTRAGQPWYAWEWLSDVLMAWAHNAGGMQAVLLGAMLLLCCTFGLLYRLVRRKSGSVLFAFLLTALAAAGSAVHWLARPHLFTMLFLVVFYSILEEQRLEERRMRLLFALPFATAIWANLHGGFLAGIILIGGYAAGELLAAVTTEDRESRDAAIGRSWRYGLTAAACLAASLVNPYTWHLHAHLLMFLENPAYFEGIAEFRSIDFRNPLALFFEIALLLGVATTFWNILQRRFVPVLLLALWVHEALLAARNIPLFMIVSAPPVGEALREWLRLLREQRAGRVAGRALAAIDSLSARLTRADAGPHWHVAGPLALAAIAVAMYGHAPGARFQATYDSQAYPEAALAVLRDPDRIFASDTWGGYLIYRRFPAKVFLDGRSDFYGPDFEREYGEVVGVRFNWAARLAAYNVDTVLLPVDAPLAGALKESRNWSVVFDDGRAIVFRRTAPGTPVTRVETESHKWQAGRTTGGRGSLQAAANNR